MHTSTLHSRTAAVAAGSSHTGAGRLRFLAGVLAGTVLLGTGTQAAQPAVAIPPREGDALTFDSSELAEITRPSPPGSPLRLQDAVGGFSVGTQDRMAVLVFFHEVYGASEGYETRMEWTGDTLTCNAGDVASVFRDDTRRRINYFRAMAGLPADITFDAVKSAKAQQAAVIMSANNGLSHDPIDDWPGGSCLTADGDEAAGNSNIALGSMGAGSVDRYIEDSGSNNRPVGHRRWLLFPPAREMGSGSVPDDGAFRRANAIWVIGNFGQRPATPEYVAWPPPGYVPYANVYSRWSFSYPQADFTSATVRMSLGSETVPVTIEARGSGAGDNTIVWVPEGIGAGAPPADIAYTVNVDNVGISGAPTDFVYEVIVMDPDDLGVQVVLNGPSTPVVAADNAYTFNAIPEATRYVFRVSGVTPGLWTEGAEDTPAPRVIDRTTGSYSPFTSSLAHTGQKSFHLAFETFDDNDQVIEVDRWIVPTATSRIRFQNRFRWAETTSQVAADVSTDGGVNWTPVYSRFGNGGTSSIDWESAWTEADIPIGAYAGSTLRVRVRYSYEPFTLVFLGVSENYGVFVDQIEVTDAQELTNITETEVPAGDTIVFRPGAPDVYFLQIQPEVAGRLWGYGPALVVQATETAPTEIVIDNIQSLPGAEVQVSFTLTGSASPADLALLRAGDPAGPFLPDSEAVLENLPEPSQYRYTSTVEGSANAFFRVRLAQ
jgi:hypothetical protein